MKTLIEVQPYLTGVGIPVYQAPSGCKEGVGGGEGGVVYLCTRLPLGEEGVGGGEGGVVYLCTRLPLGEEGVGGGEGGGHRLCLGQHIHHIRLLTLHATGGFNPVCHRKCRFAH